MESMFNGCISLTTLPDISKWKTPKLTDVSYIFDNLISSLFLPKRYVIDKYEEEDPQTEWESTFGEPVTYTTIYIYGFKK